MKTNYITKKLIKPISIMAMLLFMSVFASAQCALYFSQDNVNNGLYTVNITTGQATLVGISGGTSSTLGLAPSPGPSLLYGTTPFNLAHINTDGSGATVVGSAVAEGLAFNPVNNLLYGAINGGFRSINPANGATVATLAGPGADIEGLAYAGNNTIYGLAGFSGPMGFLYSYNISTNTWTFIGDTGIDFNLPGLAYDPGSGLLYAKGSQDAFLYSIDPVTAVPTVIGNMGIGNVGGGLAFNCAPMSCLPPNIICPPNNMGLPMGCNPAVPAPDTDLVVTEEGCGVVTVTHIGDVISDNGCNRTVTRTYRATDANGDFAECDQLFTFTFDEDEPVFSQMPPNAIVDCDAIPAVPNITATDNCGTIAPIIFINEIHYDNTGGDVGEFIEVAGTAGYDLSNCQLVLYNGSNGTVYNTLNLSGTIDNESNGFGAVAFNYPVNGIQNGSPDGMALVCDGTVIEFISYEGTLTAVGGPANGMLSTDIGVEEPSSTPVGFSLQLSGSGCSAEDFNWLPPSAESPGDINAGQVFDLNQCASSNEVPVVFNEIINPGSCPQNSTITRIWTATDNCGNTASYTQTITVQDNTAPVFCNPPVDITVDCDVPAAEEVTATDNCDFGGMNSSVWINEFHYDNSGTDVGEFIEVAGVAGTNLSGYSLVLYNGSNGLVYNTLALSGIIDNENCNRGALAFNYPVNGIQNGPDGIALLDGATVIEFLSYEGTFVANNGPATGMVSVNIGVFETSGTPVGFSLQLSGTGGGGQDFVWTAPSPDSPGSLNDGQVLQGNLVATLDEIDNTTACGGGTVIRTWTVEDACGNAATPHVQVITLNAAPAPEITCPPDVTVACIDDFVVDPNDATATSFCGDIVAIYVKQPSISGVPGCNGTVYSYIYKAVDDCGNSSSCEQLVFIDNVPATINVPAGGTVDCYEDIDLSVDDATVSGACADYNLYLVPPVVDGGLGCPGATYTFTYRLIDACGNTVEEPVVFTNAANDGPSITAPVDITCDCLAGITPNPDNATVVTSCGAESTVTVTGPQIIGTIDCPGTQYRYTYTVTDVCGRTSTDIQTFTVANTAPVFENCPADNWLVLNCEDYGGEDGTIQVIQAWIASVTASSSCGESLTVFNNFNPNNINTCVNNGYNTVTFRATDNCGRTSFCSGVYVVVDTEAPIITTEAQEHYEICNYNSQANLTAWVQNRGGAEAFDGCSNDNISWQASPANPQINCNGAMGTTSVEVTFIVTDNCGNKTSTTATFNALMAPGNDLTEDDDQQAITAATDQLELFQNQPNPFKDETTIGFYLPKDMEATLLIYDISGKEIKRLQGSYSKGYNNLNINRSELSAKGFLLYQLNTEMGSQTKRMILID